MADSTALSIQTQPAGNGQLALTSDDQLAFIADAVRTFAGVEKLANLISSMESCPAHLKGKVSDCFRVVVQAVKWRMDPFAVAECTSLVHGRLTYEGKLVAAVLRSMGAIVGRLDYDIKGKGQDAEITVSGLPKGSKKVVSITGTVKQWRTFGKDKQGNPMKNSWDSQPETMLVYRGTRQWARIFAPEAIMGVYTPDELDEIEPTPADFKVLPDEPTPARTTISEETSATQKEEPPASQEAKPTQVVHAAISAARDLFRALEKRTKGSGTTILNRLAKLHGGEQPASIPVANLESFGRDIAILAKDLDQVEINLAEFEHIAAEAK